MGQSDAQAAYLNTTRCEGQYAGLRESEGELTECTAARVRGEDRLLELLALEGVVRRVRGLDALDEALDVVLGHERDRAAAPAGTGEPAAVRTGRARDAGEVVELGARAVEEGVAAVLGRVHERAELVQDALGERAGAGDAVADVAEGEHAQGLGEDVLRAAVDLEVRGLDCGK